jgi:sugar/nucleoside kinase (ribokinase family)
MSRLLGLGSVVVDLVLDVPALPAPGGDVLAGASRTAVGGGLNALVAARTAGLPSAYAGGHGTGPFGDLVRAALSSAGVATVLAPTEGQDSGFCVVLVDPSGERTFATTIGAEGRLTADQLAGVEARPDDLVYLSGYDLAYPHGPAIAAAVEGLPAVTEVLLDPGPLVADLDTGLLARVLARATWLSLNAREARAWTGTGDPAAAAAALLAAHPSPAGVVVRTGADGCLVVPRGLPPAVVPGVAVERVVDTNGAGDVHVGTFLAGLARGLTPVEAAAQANAAAAESVTHRGPGPAPGPAS